MSLLTLEPNESLSLDQWKIETKKKIEDYPDTGRKSDNPLAET